MENERVAARTFRETFVTPNGMGWHQAQTMAIGTFTAMLFLFGGYLMGVARSLVGPVMGIISVLFFRLRNDAAVRPSVAWV